jgi:hypothetical protein
MPCPRKRFGLSSKPFKSKLLVSEKQAWPPLTEAQTPLIRESGKPSLETVNQII